MASSSLLVERPSLNFLSSHKPFSDWSWTKNKCKDLDFSAPLWTFSTDTNFSGIASSKGMSLFQAPWCRLDLLWSRLVLHLTYLHTSLQQLRPKSGKLVQTTNPHLMTLLWFFSSSVGTFLTCAKACQRVSTLCSQACTCAHTSIQHSGSVCSSFHA